LLSKLKKLQKTQPLIGDVRGKGLMIGVELVKSRKTREPAAEAANKIAYEAFKKGLLLLPCGESVIRFAPPLVINRDQISMAVDIFSSILSRIEKEFLQ
jgi:4-aminobutyrate aminotransferase